MHCSLARGYEIAAAYRAQGFAASIECCIHYLTLDEDNDVRRLGGKAKINPPLRPRAAEALALFNNPVRRAPINRSARAAFSARAYAASHGRRLAY